MSEQYVEDHVVRDFQHYISIDCNFMDKVACRMWVRQGTQEGFYAILLFSWNNVSVCRFARYESHAELAHDGSGHRLRFRGVQFHQGNGF